jgi:hypothetical protein
MNTIRASSRTTGASWCGRIEPPEIGRPPKPKEEEASVKGSKKRGEKK